MVDLQGYLRARTVEAMSAWAEEDIYAISFFIYANEAYEYGGYTN